MPKKRYTPEEIIQHLRTVELDTGKGLAVLDACRKLGITEQTYYRWKKEYGGLRVDQAKRLKGLEQENLRLKRIVADQALRSVDPERGRRGKLLSPARRREAVGHAVTVLHVSERRACRALGQLRSSYRYVPRPDHDRERLRERIIALAKEYGRYGYRTVTDMLTARGLGRGERSRVYDLAARRPESAAEAAEARPTVACRWVVPPAPACAYRNHVWSYDFVADRTHDGRPFRILNILDEYTRECLASVVARRIRSHDVLLTPGGSVPESRDPDAYSVG